MYLCEVLVDIYDEISSWGDTREIWERFVNSYNALSIGHEKQKNTSLIFYSEREPSKSKMEKELLGIRILNFGVEQLAQVT